MCVCVCLDGAHTSSLIIVSMAALSISLMDTWSWDRPAKSGTSLLAVFARWFRDKSLCNTGRCGSFKPCHKHLATFVFHKLNVRAHGILRVCVCVSHLFGFKMCSLVWLHKYFKLENYTGALGLKNDFARYSSLLKKVSC